MTVLRIPLSWPYSERGTTTAKDSRRINVMDEVSGQTTYTVKRPGYDLVSAPDFPGPGQGLTIFNGITYYITLDIFQSLATPPASGTSGSSWTSLGNAPWAARYGHQVALLNNTIYLMGGIINGSQQISDVWALGIDSAWKLCTSFSPWAGRNYFSSTVWNGRIYVMAGEGLVGGSVTYFNDVWWSDNGTDWTRATANAGWPARFGAVAVTGLNGMYIMGGQNATGALLNDIWFSPDGVDWSLVNDNCGWTVRRDFAAYYLANNIYVVGGADALGNASNQVWSSPDGLVWTLVTTTAFARAAAGFCVYGGKMWIANGQSSLTTKHNNVYFSDDASGATWSEATSNGPWDASSFGALIAAPTSTDIDDNNYSTLYWMGGLTASPFTDSDEVFYGDLDTVISSAISLGAIGGSGFVAGQLYDFVTYLAGTALLIKNASTLFVLQGGGITKVSSTGYPAVTVKGIVVLNDFVYVMDSTGLIYANNGLKLDPFLWPSINTIRANYEDDPGVMLTKYLNYIVAFGTYTLQIFYDTGAGVNGNPAGSHLAPYLNANMRVGCAAGETVCNAGPNLIWVSQTKECNRQVMMFSGLSPAVISTPFIDKLLTDGDPTAMNATMISNPGHLWYVLTIDPSKAALVYDMSTRNWYEWQQSDGSAYHWVDSAALLGSDSSTYVQDPFAGGIYAVTPSATTDNGTVITATLITGKVDGGNINRKLLDQITVIGDQVQTIPMKNHNASVAYTYDDYQSYSNYRPVDMRTNRPIVFQCGQFRRGAFKYVQADEYPMVLEALELEVSQGF